MNNSNSKWKSVRTTIQSRQTFKVLGLENSPTAFDNPQSENEFVRQAVADAGWAPFHYDRKIDGIPEPWRCHILWNQTCRQIAQRMPEWFSDMKPTNKLPAMLSACGAVVLATWIPQTQGEISDQEKLVAVNEEHLAATAAMIQNLLLLCTSAGYGTYWSSGGQFKSSTMFEKLSIDSNQKLAGAVFIEYPRSQSLELERLPGKNRDKRTSATCWTHEINLNPK